MCFTSLQLFWIMVFLCYVHYTIGTLLLKGTANTICNSCNALTNFTCRKWFGKVRLLDLKWLWTHSRPKRHFRYTKCMRLLLLLFLLLLLISITWHDRQHVSNKWHTITFRDKIMHMQRHTFTQYSLIYSSSFLFHFSLILRNSFFVFFFLFFWTW